MPRSPAVENAAGLLQKGKAAEARDMLRKHMARRPRDAEAALLLAEAHNVLGEHPQALVLIDLLVAVVADSPYVRCARAATLLGLGRVDEAYNEMNTACMMGGHGVRAPWAAAAMRYGYQEDAAYQLDIAKVFIDDNVAGVYQALCYADNVVGAKTPVQEREEHEGLAEMMTPPSPAKRGDFSNVLDGERPLRVAFLSSDFRLHSCAFFLEPLLRNLDRSSVAPLLYSTTPEPDAVTERFKTLGEWRECGRLSAGALADLARRDGVDILVDANGWTVPTQMAAVLRRLAPLQVSYLGYPNTSGAATVDWRIVDAHTDPSGGARECTEIPWRMSGCFVCFGPDTAWPVPAPTAFQRGNGLVTFGSFNNAAKITERVVHAWARVLGVVPGSRLIIKSSGLAGARSDRLRRLFAEGGVGAERLELRGHMADTAAHMAAYHEVDIALDTFPYNGTTTTCEALWMGVPVVALAGDRHRARVGVSLLNTVGAPELIAADADAYIKLAAGLAADPARLAAYRATLRERMASSVLCDAPGYARQFEEGLRHMWRAYCAE